MASYQYQYQPVTGPVWREPVASRLAWLPSVQQPARSLPPNRLGDYARPEFQALYPSEGLQWLPTDRYAGQPLAYSLQRAFVLDPFPPTPRLLEWQTRDRYAGQKLPQILRGEFVQPSFDALYKSEGLQWQWSDRYVGRILSRALLDWSVYPLQIIVPAYDPKNLEWTPKGTSPQVQIELRRLGDFAQPAFDALYKFERLEWKPEDHYGARSLQNGRADYAFVQLTVSAYDPQKLEWLSSDRYRSTAQPRSSTDYSVYPLQVTATVYDPARLEWKSEDRYSARGLPRIDYAFIQLVSAVPLPPVVSTRASEGSQRKRKASFRYDRWGRKKKQALRASPEAVQIIREVAQAYSDVPDFAAALARLDFELKKEQIRTISVYGELLKLEIDRLEFEKQLDEEDDDFMMLQ